MVPLGDRCTPIKKAADEWDAKAKAFNTARAKWFADCSTLRSALSQEKLTPAIAKAEAEQHPDKTLEHIEDEVVDKFTDGILEHIERQGALSTAMKAEKAKAAAGVLKEATEAKNVAADNLRKAARKLSEARSAAAARTGTAGSMVARELEEKAAKTLARKASTELFEAAAKEGVANGLSEAAAKDFAKALLKQSLKAAVADFSVALGRANFVLAFLDPNEGIATDEQEHEAWAKQNAEERAEASKRLEELMKGIANPSDR